MYSKGWEKWARVPLYFWTAVLISGFIAAGATIFALSLIEGSSCGISFSGCSSMPFSSDRVISASQAIIQLDSFIAGGWIVGFVFFWGSLKDVRREILSSTGRIEDEVKFGEIPIPSEDVRVRLNEIESIGKETMLEMTGKMRAFFAMTTLPLILLASSGFVSILAIITAQGIYLWASLTNLNYGVGAILIGWYYLHDLGEQLDDFMNESLSIERMLRWTKKYHKTNDSER